MAWIDSGSGKDFRKGVTGSIQYIFVLFVVKNIPPTYYSFTEGGDETPPYPGRCVIGYGWVLIGNRKNRNRYYYYIYFDLYIFSYYFIRSFDIMVWEMCEQQCLHERDSVPVHDPG